MIVGLTGGIASGKSTVSGFFQSYGFPVVDADIGAREVVEKGSPGLKHIQQYFGNHVIQPDGTLDRARLGAEVFTDETKRRALNQLLSKDIRRWIEKKLEAAKETGASLIVLDIPLLFEAGYDQVVDKTMVVTVKKETQLQRLMKRNDLSHDEALSRISAQMPLEEKEKRADFLIDNNGTIEETKQQLDVWLTQHGFFPNKS